MTGLSDPAAKGAMERGIRAAEMSLQAIFSVVIQQNLSFVDVPPLKCPVIASMRRMGRHCWDRIVSCSLPSIL